LLCIIDPLIRNPIAFRIAIRNIELQSRMEVTEKTVDNRYGGGSIDIVVTIDQNLFFIADGTFNPVDCPVHVFHQKRIVKMVKRRAEKVFRLVEGFDLTVY